ncbi:MAG TPA: mechanosensitive ion channel [Bacteroidales bacterium]|nr:mechanosensitive ion channel [Bacteroidales bacterium]
MSSLIQLIIPSDSIFSPNTAQTSFGELIKSGKYDQVLDNALTWSIDFAANIVLALVLFFVGRFIILKISGLSNKILKKSSWDGVLKGFISSIIQTILFVVLFMIIINAVGVKTVSIAALIGTLGLAIGLAMKDNLSNFAGGVLILLSKPFRGGDYIKAQGLEGTVVSIGILHTILRTGDNKTVYIPNGPLSTGNITNNNSLDGTLRTDIVVNVDYGSDVEEVKKELLAIAREHPKVLIQPDPFARMTKINTATLEFTVRVWAEKADLWGVNYDLTEKIYQSLYEKGMISSLQQMTIHMAKE